LILSELIAWIAYAALILVSLAFFWSVEKSFTDASKRLELARQRIELQNGLLKDARLELNEIRKTLSTKAGIREVEEQLEKATRAILHAQAIKAKNEQKKQRENS